MVDAARRRAGHLGQRLPAILVGSVLASLLVVHPTVTPSGTGALLALASLAVAALLLLMAGRAHLPQSQRPGLRSSVLRHAEQTAFLRLRDPDAAGRPRSRAPSVQPATV